MNEKDIRKEPFWVCFSGEAHLIKNRKYDEGQSKQQRQEKPNLQLTPGDEMIDRTHRCPQCEMVRESETADCRVLGYQAAWYRRRWITRIAVLPAIIFCVIPRLM